MHHRRPILVASVVLAMVGTVTLFSCRGTGMDTAAEMKASLNKDIPAGTAVETAEARLKTRGFAVSSETDGSWGGRRHLDFLYGDMHEGAVVQRRWQVAVFNKGGVVTGTDVSTGLIGP